MNEHTDSPERLFTAVILSFNSARYIEACVASLLNAFSAFDEASEIIIIENGSRDDSRQLVEALAAANPDVVRPIYSAHNLGTTVSRNRALAAGRGRYFLIIDSDATLEGAALVTLKAALDADRGAGMVVPRLQYPDGRHQISTDQFPTVLHKLRRFLFLKDMEQDSAPPDAACDVDYAISACWLLPRSVIEDVGMLDENIFYSPEDVDYCVRVWLTGYRIVYCPAALATHDAQELSRGDKLSRFTLRHIKGLAYYFAKHRYCLTRWGLARRIPRVKKVRPSTPMDAQSAA